MLWDNIVLFLEIMLINIVLSGDNAVVIALASKNLPVAQRKQAIWWGAFGAIALRVLLTLAAVYVLDIPYIQGIGSLLLLWIAIKLLVDEDGHSDVKEASTLGKAISTIILADFVMSLDNVLAIAAKAKGEVGVIILGIGLSIPIIIWGSNLVVTLLKKFPVLVFLGAGILGYTAGEMFMADEQISHLVLGDIPHYVLPTVTTVIVIVSGVLKKLIVRPKHS
ncbi:TerC family protein [Paenibacillus validus]|uniref:YjbE family putative metal transport protein n=1 Tax=Paenibacillus validus TaxID=44253 RepID=A0A7X3CT89_9BACL|nr:MULTISPECIES: TerC family protein [Paenibacillus]MED4601138.1 TerC family protein [Paenibacillus validus]MED4608186.1 TerC family protein [Paenibacillus validus]MUG72565.1 YjbE family putative metal transport protein [Paenibacillus validus]